MPSEITFTQALRKYRIAVAPTFRNKGPVQWFAGQRSLDNNGNNVVLPERRVDNKSSPEEALRALLLKLGEDNDLAENPVLFEDSPEPVDAKPEPPKPLKVETVGDKPEPEIIEKDGRFFLNLSDGRVYQATRKRDLVRKLKSLTIT